MGTDVKGQSARESDSHQMIPYWLALIAVSILVFFIERVFAHRQEQSWLRRSLLSDLFHLGFNGHVVGVLLYAFAGRYLIEPDFQSVAADWPMWLQVIAAIISLDFIQWCVHNALHRVPFLWHFHKLHHGVADGEMDWIVSFRFQWIEVVIYQGMMALPLAWLGFSVEALWIQAIFGTLIGHLNHANLSWTYGPFRYLFNNPAMHIWHHAHDGPTRNFGIVLSIWDWVFGTAILPDQPPSKLGYDGMEELPTEFFSQQFWQLGRWLPQPAVSVAGLILIASACWGLV
jgi:sterol desaturase/sphingolipid hydroxylase (fatty acid hydroxylase superfamily)